MSFRNLADTNIQPKKLPAEFIPQIQLSPSLRKGLTDYLKKQIGEDSYIDIGQFNSTIGKSDSKSVFFSNQWFYLAYSCEEYALALIDYVDFYENYIKQSFTSIPDDANPKYNGLFANRSSQEFDYFGKFLRADSGFRPGKKCFDSTNFRGPMELFGSIVLATLPVLNASAEWLGTLIYYLAKKAQLYRLLSSEVHSQVEIAEKTLHKLPSPVRDCAREIINRLYQLDNFERLKDYFDVGGDTIKIKDPKSTNKLSSVFVKMSSGVYGNPRRTFIDKEYDFSFMGVSEKCRLSNQWWGKIDEKGRNGNSLETLIEVANRYYSDKLEVKDTTDGKYLRDVEGFSEGVLDEAFKSPFAKRYITALLAKPFVILTGNSGTGKTRIAVQFAKYLQAQPSSNNGEVGKVSKNWLLVPVGADWTDNTKVLGYFNPLANENQGEYIQTDIFRLMQSANEHPETPYFLILDEMNLSHVERYFSDFLSHMESPEVPFMIDGIDAEIQFPKNLYITGTVNVDETTYMFSPKVLDRANVIEFKPNQEEVLSEFIDSSTSQFINPAPSWMSLAFMQLAKKVRGEDCPHKSEMEEVKKTMEELLEILSMSDFGFAFRTAKEIRLYVSAALEFRKDVDLTTVIDEQVVQKILPKIHGNRKEIEKLLQDLKAFCDSKNYSESAKKIEKMQRRLDQVHFASFM